jgi:hypothetical protein
MLPKKVVIMNTLFNVTEKAIEDCGESNQPEREIIIDKKLATVTKVETFYHEVAHMMLVHSGYANLLKEPLEEALAQYLGVALAELITFNRNLPKLPYGSIKEVPNVQKAS